jgi:hypothetical protein
MGISMKYHEVNVVEEHADHKSELYGPQMRFGEHPKRRHEVINARSRFLTHVKGENINYIYEKLRIVNKYSLHIKLKICN